MVTAFHEHDVSTGWSHSWLIIPGFDKNTRTVAVKRTMSKDGFMQNLLADGKKPQTAAGKIPILARGAVSDRAKETLNLVS